MHVCVRVCTHIHDNWKGFTITGKAAGRPHPLLQLLQALALFSTELNVFVLFYETGFLCVAPAVLELTPQTKLAMNPEICLSPPPECSNQRHAP